MNKRKICADRIKTIAISAAGIYNRFCINDYVFNAEKTEQGAFPFLFSERVHEKYVFMNL